MSGADAKKKLVTNLARKGLHKREIAEKAKCSVRRVYQLLGI